eukprot:8058853-Alexandrium_andersonii.AAC.1
MRKPLQENTGSPRTTAERKHRAIFFLSPPAKPELQAAPAMDPRRAEQIEKRTSAPGPTPRSNSDGTTPRAQLRIMLARGAGPGTSSVTA